MSGSGSAVFGIFENDAVAQTSFEILSREYPAAYTPSNFVIT
jgi:4-diphosphocytidyl-2C-methyl-D-erythritol kinase